MSRLDDINQLLRQTEYFSASEVRYLVGEVERLTAELTAWIEQERNQFRYLCVRGHHVASANPQCVGAPCSAPVTPGGRLAVAEPERGSPCGAPLQRYASPDWFDEDINAEVVRLTAENAALRRKLDEFKVMGYFRFVEGVGRGVVGEVVGAGVEGWANDSDLVAYRRGTETKMTRAAAATAERAAGVPEDTKPLQHNPDPIRIRRADGTTYTMGEDT